LIGLHEFKANDAHDNDEEEKRAHETERRAFFYVAATRAKYLLYLSGVNEKEESLLNEIEKTHLLLEDKNIYKYDPETE
jgi:ATP-dependent exoDNAse (exonuclease V) beta subunit